MWIVGVTQHGGYPFINEHETYNDAKKDYDEKVEEYIREDLEELDDCRVYLAEVGESNAGKAFKYNKDLWD